VAVAVTRTSERQSRGEGTGLGAPWNVIVLNDDHNTFDGVAAALADIVGMTFNEGLALADRIHNRGRAIVWSGHRELAEHYWSGLHRKGLTMAPLET
jgi:ATP-dependent Clp protease adaptor protein ClpS